MLRKIVLANCLLFVAYSVAQLRLTNDSVLELVGSGASEDTIVRMIERSDGQYNLSDGETARLKRGGVSNRVLQAMAAKIAGGNTPWPTVQVPEPEREGVVYFFDEGTNKLTPLTLEFGSSKGKAKLGGLAGAKTVLDLSGEQSSVRFKSGEHASFLIRVSGGPNALTYLPDTFDLSTLVGPLHTFTASKGKRERTAYDVAFYGVVAKNKDKTGTDVALTAKPAAGNILRITSTKALPPGEYGFMLASPPVEVALAMANAKADTAYYTFAIVP